jgi:hypothetical protein
VAASFEALVMHLPEGSDENHEWPRSRLFLKF